MDTTSFFFLDNYGYQTKVLNDDVEHRLHHCKVSKQTLKIISDNEN